MPMNRVVALGIVGWIAFAALGGCQGADPFDRPADGSVTGGGGRIVTGNGGRVVTGNGGLQQAKVQGAAEVRRAQAWVAKFNALASVPAPQPTAGPAVTSYDAPDAGFNPDYLGREERSIDRQPAPGRHRGAPEAPA